LDAAPPASWRSAAGQKVAREAHRFSGRTAIHAAISVHEPQPPDDPETPLAFTMEGDHNPVPGPIQPRYWWPGWNSMNSITKFQIEVNGPLYEANPGRRLVEPSTGPRVGAESLRRIAPAEHTGVWLVPRPAIFGSEELSSLAPGIAELSPTPEVVMCKNMAGKLGVSEGDPVPFDAGGRIMSLTCRLDESVAPDTVLVPANLPRTVGIVAPIQLKLARAE
jgi:NADH-quinone oxidoreductase subunit G